MTNIEKSEVLKSFGQNSWKTIMIHKNFRQHVDVKWKDVICLELPMEQQRA